MVLNCFFHLVILLYLMDNDTSNMILISSGIGLLIEVWKIKKAVVIKKVSWNSFSVEAAQSYSQTETAGYDQIAMLHLQYVMYPLLVGFAVYSLLYGTHKSWYSWVVSSLTQFVYAFGTSAV
jgi:hypothetical protein